MMRTYILLVICFLSGVTGSAKTPGQSLDETIQILKGNLTSLATLDQHIVTKVNRIVKDVKALQLMHGPCSPCKVYQGSSNNMCDCTAFQPKQDCLTFNENGFKVNGCLLYTSPSPRDS